MYAQTAAALQTALCERHGFSAEDVWVLFGAETDAIEPLASRRGPATRPNVLAAVQEFTAACRPQDAAWVILLGHVHYDNRSAWWSLPGPDLNEDDLGESFAGLKAREQVFFITFPASGYYLKTLSAPGRVVISATEADLEVNETIYHEFLARRLAPPADVAESERDIDGDGAATIIDLYVGVARDVAQAYLEKNLLATEHAQLDDNGDGRGTELQIDYLTEAQGGRPAGADTPLKKPTDDGALAKSIRLFSAANETHEPPESAAPPEPPSPPEPAEPAAPPEPAAE